MKKIILTLIAAVTAFGVQAQNINPGQGDHMVTNNDDDTAKSCCRSNQLSGWCIDVNIMGGVLNQAYIHNDLAAAYTNPVNTKTGGIDFKQGSSYSFEAQAGYFFGQKRHWGIGLGFMYMYQTGNVTLDNFHAEYQSYDNFGNVFRQEVTANNPITESMRISSYNIPIVAKYQTMFSKHVGFTADAGLLFNIHVQNSYKTNASFDYEAVYDYQGNEGVVTPVYDAAPTPGASDLLITKAQYAATHSGANIQDYFNTLKSEGYNVGLNQHPNSNTGTVSYTNASLGFLIRPAVSFYLCQNFSLNVGLYYYYQNFNSTAASNYHITDKVGDYSSVLNTVTNTTNNSYGISVGARYTFCKRATCTPAIPELAPEPEIVEPEAPAPPPPAVEAEEPEVSHVDISTPLLFDLNKVVIKESSIPILEEAVKELRQNPGATLTINGYTDNTGTKDYNKKLSKKRAAVVKNYLRKKGVDPKILKTVGHGEGHPAASNKTKEGRMRNRRVIMDMDEKK